MDDVVTTNHGTIDRRYATCRVVCVACNAFCRPWITRSACRISKPALALFEQVPLRVVGEGRPLSTIVDTDRSGEDRMPIRLRRSSYRRSLCLRTFDLQKPIRIVAIGCRHAEIVCLTRDEIGVDVIESANHLAIPELLLSLPKTYATVDVHRRPDFATELSLRLDTNAIRMGPDADTFQPVPMHGADRSVQSIVAKGCEPLAVATNDPRELVVRRPTHRILIIEVVRGVVIGIGDLNEVCVKAFEQVPTVAIAQPSTVGLIDRLQSSKSVVAEDQRAALTVADTN
jgi:hypothetical protein